MEKGYKTRVKQQIAEWVKGNPQHNKVDDECCPDFSCCKPELLQPEEIRKAFAVANEYTRMSMLGAFLGAGLALMASDKNVFIANGKTELIVDQN